MTDCILKRYFTMKKKVFSFGISTFYLLLIVFSSLIQFFIKSFITTPCVAMRRGSFQRSGISGQREILGYTSAELRFEQSTRQPKRTPE